MLKTMNLIVSPGQQAFFFESDQSRGIFVPGCFACKVGEKVEVTIENDDNQKVLKVNGRINWINHVDDIGVGVDVISMTDEQFKLGIKTIGRVVYL